MFLPKGANVNFIEKRGAKRSPSALTSAGWKMKRSPAGPGVVASALIFAATENVDGPIGVLVRGGSELTVRFQARRQTISRTSR